MEKKELRTEEKIDLAKQTIYELALTNREKEIEELIEHDFIDADLALKRIRRLKFEINYLIDSYNTDNERYLLALLHGLPIQPE